ncbi:MAG: ABC transporter ATP-binding protein, partial [Pedobacter sp.]|nr:ABC transporter ATP-binding protein [Pedobacter sp.]
TNGLDPNGIIEIRNLMIELATKHNKTILVSSHLLAEIERTATHVGIINKGELLFQGTIDDLHNLSKPTIKLEVDDVEKATTLLAASAEILQQKANTLTLTFNSKEDIATVNSLLVTNGIKAYAIGTERKDLENLFLDITSKN